MFETEVDGKDYIISFDERNDGDNIGGYMVVCKQEDCTCYIRIGDNGNGGFEWYVYDGDEMDDVIIQNLGRQIEAFNYRPAL